jgi:hypothetical protein
MLSGPVMMFPPAANRDGALQIRMIAMNILIKKSRTSDREWDRRVVYSYHENNVVL